MSATNGNAADQYSLLYPTTQYDGHPHPSIYCRRCGKCLDVDESRVGWCRGCDLVEALRVFGTTKTVKVNP